MQTSTFTPKLLRQQSFFRFLLPLFAIFLGMGASQQAMAQGPAIDDLELIFSQQPTGAPAATTVHYAGNGALDAPYTGYTKLGSASPTPATTAPNLGTYDIDAGGTSMLILSGSSLVAEPVTIRGVTSTPVAARVRYRVYLIGTPAANQPPFSVITLNSAGPFPGFPTATLFNATTSLNLLSGLLSGGTYTVESNFESDYSNGTTNTAIGNTYTASFTVTAPAVTPPGGTTTWISTSSNNWTVATNWSNGVPTRFSNAILPAKTTDLSNTVTPVLTLSTPDLYEVLTLTLNGLTNADRALLRVGPTTGGATSGATLNVYGDLNVQAGGILAPTIGAPDVANPSQNSSIFLRGGDQVIRGVLNIADLRIDGTGVKNVVNTINVNNTLVFAPGISAIMRTVTEIPGSNGSPSTFPLNTTQTASVQLNGTIVSSASSASSETNTAYIEGITIAKRSQPVAGQLYTYGNIGLDISTNNPINTQVTITRTVGLALNAPTFPGRTPFPVKRQYGVSGDVNNAPNVSTIVFHYLDSADELNGNNDETQLVIFRATNNGPPYALIGGVADPALNTVTQSGVRTINTITLGSKNNPLPVTLVSFDAQRVGEDALVNWTSAQEINSKGYNVQVSTNGSDYKTLAFVASETPNSSSTRSYSFTDTEKNKVGVRYYRLQQVDVDGKSAYFTPRAITFEGKPTASGVVAYPNPFAYEMRLSLNSATSGDALVRISDMTGRLVGQRQLAINTGANDIAVEGVALLKNGMYTMTVTLPSGETKSMKVVKQ